MLVDGHPRQAVRRRVSAVTGARRAHSPSLAALVGRRCSRCSPACVSWFLPRRAERDLDADRRGGRRRAAAVLRPGSSTWTGCGDGMQCATATAPLDWANPARRAIELALVRQPATAATASARCSSTPAARAARASTSSRTASTSRPSERLQQQLRHRRLRPARRRRARRAVSCYDDPAELDAYLYDIMPGDVGIGRVDRGSRGSERGVRRSVPRAHRRAARLRRHRERRARPRPAARGARRRRSSTTSATRTARFLGATYADLFPQQDRPPRARRRDRPGDDRLRRHARRRRRASRARCAPTSPTASARATARSPGTVDDAMRRSRDAARHGSTRARSAPTTAASSAASTMFTRSSCPLYNAEQLAVPRRSCSPR